MPELPAGEERARGRALVAAGQKPGCVAHDPGRPPERHSSVGRLGPAIHDGVPGAPLAADAVDQQERLALAAPHVVQCHAMDILPDWEPGTPGVLCVAGPHAIPVSTAQRTSDRRIVFALGRERATLARLREDPEAALCLLGRGVAFTAYGRAAVVREEL